MDVDEALKDCEFPILQLAKLLDSLSAEFLTLDSADPNARARAPYFREFFKAVRELSASYSKIRDSRRGPLQIH